MSEGLCRDAGAAALQVHDAPQVESPSASPTEQHHKMALQNRRLADLDIFADDVAEVLEQNKAAEAENAAARANPALQDNFDDAEGYYNFQARWRSACWCLAACRSALCSADRCFQAAALPCARPDGAACLASCCPKIWLLHMPMHAARSAGSRVLCVGAQSAVSSESCASSSTCLHSMGCSQKRSFTPSMRQHACKLPAMQATDMASWAGGRAGG